MKFALIGLDANSIGPLLVGPQLIGPLISGLPYPVYYKVGLNYDGRWSLAIGDRNIKLFEDEELTELEDILDLTKQDLKDLGVKFGSINKITKLAEQLKSGNAPDTNATSNSIMLREMVEEEKQVYVQDLT